MALLLAASMSSSSICKAVSKSSGRGACCTGAPVHVNLMSANLQAPPAGPCQKASGIIQKSSSVSWTKSDRETDSPVSPPTCRMTGTGPGRMASELHAMRRSVWPSLIHWTAWTVCRTPRYCPLAMRAVRQMARWLFISSSSLVAAFGVCMTLMLLGGKLSGWGRGGGEGGQVGGEWHEGHERFSFLTWHLCTAHQLCVQNYQRLELRQCLYGCLFQSVDTRLHGNYWTLIPLSWG